MSARVLRLSIETGGEARCRKPSSLGSLTHEDVLVGSLEEAKRLIAASLLAWGIPVETRDSVKSIVMFHRLNMSLNDVRAFLTRNRLYPPAPNTD